MKKTKQPSKPQVGNKAMRKPKPKQKVFGQVTNLRKNPVIGPRGSAPENYVMRNVKFSRSLYDNGAYVQSVPPVGFARAFQLDELPGYTDFTTLWDQYRITRVAYRIIPRVNVQTLAIQAVVTTAVMPTISVWWDPDDATTPTLVGESLEVENAQHCAGYEIVEGSFKPHAAIGAYGGAFTQFADFDGWCDCTSDDVEWYGLKVWVGAGGGSQTVFQTWDAFYTVSCEFRKVR
jgi:hypothetical protein